MSFLVQLDNLNTQEGSHTTTATPTLTLVNFLEGRTLKSKAPLKTLYLFLYLSEGKLIYIALFWAVTLNFWVPPSWPKMALNTKKC